jgi:hypothetical protein
MLPVCVAPADLHPQCLQRRVLVLGCDLGGLGNGFAVPLLFCHLQRSAGQSRRGVVCLCAYVNACVRVRAFLHLQSEVSRSRRMVCLSVHVYACVCVRMEVCRHSVSRSNVLNATEATNRCVYPHAHVTASVWLPSCVRLASSSTASHHHFGICPSVCTFRVQLSLTHSPTNHSLSRSVAHSPASLALRPFVAAPVCVPCCRQQPPPPAAGSAPPWTRAPVSIRGATENGNGNGHGHGHGNARTAPHGHVLLTQHNGAVVSGQQQLRWC